MQLCSTQLDDQSNRNSTEDQRLSLLCTQLVHQSICFCLRWIYQ